MQDYITFDCSFGESGGQIIRNASALSCILGKGVVLNQIRKKRPVPGLRAQHHEGLNLLSRYTSTTIEKNYIGSEDVIIHPGGDVLSWRISEKLVANCHGAGSCNLMIQTILPCLLYSGKGEVEFVGGTDVPFSPPSDFTKHVLIPLLRMKVPQLGEINFDIQRRGVMPKGGGVIQLSVSRSEEIANHDLNRESVMTSNSISSIVNSKHSQKQNGGGEFENNHSESGEPKPLPPILIQERGSLRGISVFVFGSGNEELHEKVPSILQGLKTRLQSIFQEEHLYFSFETELPKTIQKEDGGKRSKGKKSKGKGSKEKKSKAHEKYEDLKEKTRTKETEQILDGNIPVCAYSKFIHGSSTLSIVVRLEYTNTIMGISHLCSKRPSSRSLNELLNEIAEKLEQHVTSEACVDEYMEDQLILYMALLGGTSVIHCLPQISEHTRTAIHFVGKLTGAQFNIIEEGKKTIVSCEGIGVMKR